MARRLPVREFVEALIDADQARARAVAQDTFQATNSRTSVFADLMHPAAHQIGELWYLGQIGVAVEHGATAIASAIIEDFPPTPSDRPVRAGTSCLLAAVGQEQHVIGLRVLQLALEDDGWSVEQLGGQTPVGETVALVASDGPPSSACQAVTSQASGQSVTRSSRRRYSESRCWLEALPLYGCRSCGAELGRLGTVSMLVWVWC
jgi:methanogenic corrinoid protein MtbC1